MHPAQEAAHAKMTRESINEVRKNCCIVLPIDACYIICLCNSNYSIDTINKFI